MPSPAPFGMSQRSRAGDWRPGKSGCQKATKQSSIFPVQRTIVPSNAKRNTVERMAPYAKNHWMGDAIVSRAQRRAGTDPGIKSSREAPHTFKPVTDLFASGAGASASLMDFPGPSATSVSGCESVGVVSSARFLSSSRIFSAGSSVELLLSAAMLENARSTSRL